MKELLEQYVNKRGTIAFGTLLVEVNITDVKLAYGNARFQVSPVAGSGIAWVEKVTLLEEESHTLRA